jgi:glutaredoxin 3
MANIKMYTTPTCVYCKIAKEFFAKNNISYQELNVIDDDAAREEMIQKSHQLGVPVIDVDGEIFIGFDKPGIVRALKLGK